MASSLVTLQFELLRDLFDLSRAQRASLERDDIDQVLELMTERESILERLAELVAVGEDAPENVVRFTGADDYERQDALALDTVIRGIIEHDRGNEAILFEKLDEVRRELPRLDQGRRLASAYRPAEASVASVSRTS